MAAVSLCTKIINAVSAQGWIAASSQSDLTSHCYGGRHGSAKPSAIRLSGCRLCGWEKTTRIYVDEMQVSLPYLSSL